MPSDSKRTVSTTLDSAKDKQVIEEFARSRGYRRTSDLLRVALFEYLRRHRPSESTQIGVHVTGLLGD